MLMIALTGRQENRNIFKLAAFISKAHRQKIPGLTSGSRTTGAQREHRYEVLKKQAEEKGLAEDVKFYLEFFQYGCPPHGGFGLGIDRLTMLLVGESIKDAEFLFRGPNRLTP